MYVTFNTKERQGKSEAIVYLQDGAARETPAADPIEMLLDELTDLASPGGAPLALICDLAGKANREIKKSNLQVPGFDHDAVMAAAETIRQHLGVAIVALSKARLG